jgi:rhamnulokinase
MASPGREGSTYLAFDLGASSGRALLGRLEGGRISVEELHRFDTPLLERDGHLYWDVERLQGDLETGLALALERDGRLRSLSVDSWGVDYVPLDREGSPVRPPFAYRDPRTAGRITEAARIMPLERIYRHTGIQFLEINTLYQLLADRREEPELFDRTRNRLTIADYFNYRFSGRAVSEVSLASTTQLLDAETRDWSAPVLAAFEVPSDTMPEVVPSGTRLGPVRGAESVTVVAGCSHDTACAVAAVPAAPSGPPWAYISSGTWSLVGVERAEPLLTDAARSAGMTNEAGLDGTVRFLRNMTGLWILQECERAWREVGIVVGYDELMEEAAAAPSPADCLDVDDPRFSLRGDMQETIGSYCRELGSRAPATRGELVRLVIESLAEGHRRIIRELERVIEERIEIIHLVGGGSRNAMLCQLTADRCGCRVVAGPAEATALGNLLVQARAMGDLPPDRPIRDVVRNSLSLQSYEPSTSDSPPRVRGRGR